MAEPPVLDRSRPFIDVTAELLRDFQVQVTIDRSNPGKGYGPWSLVIDESPESGSRGAGPSPVTVALGALAA